LKQFIEAWGANSPNTSKTPQSREVRGRGKVVLGFTSGGACRLAKPSRKERSRIKRFKTILKEERIISEDEFIMHVMEADSFNDTIKKVEVVVDLGCPHDQQMIAVNSVDMYTIIDDYRQGILTESATVSTKYKMVDKKIKPISIPLPEDSWQRMKEVAKDFELERSQENWSHFHEGGPIQIGTHQWMCRFGGGGCRARKFTRFESGCRAMFCKRSRLE
jgi:hypothetical protein